MPITMTLSGPSFTGADGLSIDLTSFASTVADGQSNTNGTGGGAGKPTVSPIAVTYRWEVASPEIWGSTLAGRIFSNVAIHFTRANRAGVEHVYASVTLKNAQIVSFGMSSGGELPAVQLTWDFAEINMTSFDGAGNVVFSDTYNVNTNKGG